MKYNKEKLTQEDLIKSLKVLHRQAIEWLVEKGYNKKQIEKSLNIQNSSINDIYTAYTDYMR